MEPNEMSEFSKQMKEAGEESLTHVSLIVSVLAVLVALVTVLGHRTHTEATIMQTRAADKWNQFQSHVLRESITQKASDLLSLQPSSNGAKVDATLEKYAGELEKTKKSMESEQETAKDFEAEVEKAERRASRYDIGEALLQIAVILASITLLTKRSVYVLTAVLLGVIGLAVAASAFLVH